MINKLFKAIKEKHFLLSIKSRARFVFRISNKNVYADYTRSVEFNFLKRKFKKVIESGVNDDLVMKPSNKIWICWLQGIENAPELVKSCVNSTKKLFRDYDVIILSEKNIDNYIDLPQHIKTKYEKRVIPPAQYTDIIRTALLCKYGGGWLDATVFCSASIVPRNVYEPSLFVFKQLDLRNKDVQPVLASNWLIFAKSNHPILMLTQKLLYAYWEQYNYLRHYFIFHLFFSMACQRYSNLWQEVPTFENHAPHVLQKELGNPFSESRWNQICRFADFHKLNRRFVPSANKNSFYTFIVSNN